MLGSRTKNESRPRLLIIGHEEANLLACYIFTLQSGFRPVIYDTPVVCELFDPEVQRCTRETGCADALLVERQQPEMDGLELIRRQHARGCRIPPEKKALLGPGLNEEESRSCKEIGCRFLQEPLTVEAFREWLESCRPPTP